MAPVAPSPSVVNVVDEPALTARLDLSSTLGLDIGPTHHTLVSSELDRYLYPVNMPVRDYQRNMIRRALIRNLMVALPTGLGKTFIASVVMWNWYRWTASAKIIFLAPTRPLVTQQVENFLQMTGISVRDTAVFIQQVVKKRDRELLWNSRRVFFATPQTVENDIAAGMVNVRDIVCLVVDEAHRATGNYSYVNLVREIRQHNKSVRILALTATPSGHFEGVQQVVDNLCISATEIRTEESLDVREYTHAKHLNKIVLQPDSNTLKLLSLLRKLLEPQLYPFYQRKIVATLDPAQIHPFSFTEGIKRYLKSPAKKTEFWVRAKGQLIYSMLYATGMLMTDGIYQFYQRIDDIQQQFIKSAKPGVNLSKLCQAPEFGALVQVCRELIYQPCTDTSTSAVAGTTSTTRNPDFMGHPKLERLVEILDYFYRCNGADSRCIIFANFRETAQEIQWVLSHQQPSVVSSLFVGQQSSAQGVKGMTQKEQQQLLDRFRQGEVNVLIATSVAEEGLDIAQVDLIVCYDQSSSPIRSIQRMGRTGRARDGNVYILMTEKESKKLEHALSGHKWVENRINHNADSSVKLVYCESPRILPPVNQRYVEVVVEAPPENKEAVESGDLLLAMRPTERDGKRPASRARKAPPKKRSKPGARPERVRWSFEDSDEDADPDTSVNGDKDSAGADGAGDTTKSTPVPISTSTFISTRTSTPTPTPGSASCPIDLSIPPDITFSDSD